MNPVNLLQPSYWFAEAPLLTPLALRAMVVFFGALLLAAVVLKIKSAKAEPALARGWRKISRWCVGLSIFGLVILFFRYQFVPLLSRRFIYLVWLGLAAVGLRSSLKYFLKQLPERQRQSAEQLKRGKYLP